MNESPWARYAPTFIQECPMCSAIHENHRGWDEYCPDHTEHQNKGWRACY